MQEMNCVKVIVEKAEYAADGVHKGMHGWICMEQSVEGYWLVNFPQCYDKEDIATISICEDDLKVIPVMYAKVNEVIKARFEKAAALRERIIEMDLMWCQSVDELHEVIWTAFDVPECYEKNQDAFWRFLQGECKAETVIIKGVQGLPPTLGESIDHIRKLLEDKVEVNKKSDLHPFSYEIES